MKKDDIKTLIVIFIACFVCVMIIFILNFKSNFDKLKNLNDYDTFFTCTNYVNNYINLLSSKNYNSLSKILDKKYLEENDNINMEYNYDVSLSTKNIQYVKLHSNYIYYIKGEIIQNTFDGSVVLNKDYKIILLIDSKNNTYSLYPVNDNYEEVINSIRKINISKNDYNSLIKEINVSDDQICVLHLSNYLNMLNNNINEAYNLLSDDMKKRYDNVDEYKIFVDNNNINLNTSSVKCLKQEYKDKVVYNVIDKNSIKYVFNEKSILNYNVDIYVINENR